MRVLAKCLVLLVLLVAPPALAQSEPPARVGRVGLIEGTLAFYGPGDSDWSAANVNLPVATGGWFATDATSRAQLGIGPDLLNLANDTQLNVADLRESVMQLALTQGRVNLHLRRLLWRKNESAEIDIPRGGIWLLQPGRYDIDGGAQGQPSRITVFAGSARFVGGGIDRVIKAGDTLVVSGGDTLSAEVQRVAPDEFDAWCEAHDYRENRVAASRHVSPGMTGYEQLDEYGQWNTVPSYGAVWFPQSTRADWAPYRDGHWVWLEPWGWNWVDDEPWGFAPFHYGRWARIDDRWGWVPGEFVAEPVYAPALVAFIPPPAIEADVAFGADAGPPVAWFPLAPGELYWPAYSRDPTYIRNVNITNVNITNINQVTNVLLTQPALADPPPAVVSQRFANRGAATVVPAQVFANSAPVAPATVRVPSSVLQKAAVAAAPPQAVAHPAVTSAISPPHGPAAGTITAGTPPAAQTKAATAPFATPQHPPARPQFSQLGAAPRISRPAVAAHQVPASSALPATAATVPPAHPQPAPAAPPPTVASAPGTPNFSRLAPASNAPRGPSPGIQSAVPNASAPPPAGPRMAQPGGPPAMTATAAKPSPGAPPAPVGGPAARLGHPPGPPDFAHLPAWHPGPNASPQPDQRATPRQAHGQAPPRQPAQAAPPSLAVPSAQPPVATAHAGAPSTLQPAQSPQMPQPAAPPAQRRAATEAQQRAAAQAAAQAQQRAAAQAAAAQAQQRAAAQAAAQAQQRAAAQAAAQAQQRAAAQAAARQHQAQACGHPGGPPCPK